MRISLIVSYNTFDQKGMTLLEIMVALLILGTVVTMVTISLSGSLDIMNATKDQGEIYHRAQVALQRLSEDLSSAMLVENAEFIGTDDHLNGEDADSLHFNSTAHVVFNSEVDTPGIAAIAYNVVEDSERDGELVLFRSDQLLSVMDPRQSADDAGKRFVLSDRLRSVKFSYFDEEGVETETWTTDKDALSGQSERKLPVAVACTLEFWVDRESETSLQFSTTVFLPVGLIDAQYNQAKGS